MGIQINAHCFIYNPETAGWIVIIEQYVQTL